MTEQPINAKWWQRPQPVWVSSLLSTLTLLALFGLWNIGQIVRGQEGDGMGLEATTSSTNHLIPYQGFLTNTSDQPLNGNQTIQIELFNASSGGTSVWGPEIHTNVPVTDGLFALSLGSKMTGGIPSHIWNNGTLYVQLTVNGQVLSPREPILTPPPRTWHLLGMKTADPTTPTPVAGLNGWQVVRGATPQEYIEVTVATQGGLIESKMTARYRTSDPVRMWCGIEVYDQNNDLIQQIHLDGGGSDSAIDFGCSGSYQIELPAGTYTFKAVTYTNAETTVTWRNERQISVSEYR